MREIKLPAYPLFTFDPLMSLWSMSDRLYDDEIKMWTAHDKPIKGYVVVDGTAYRFMGAGKGPVLPQVSVEMGLSSTKYTFASDLIRLEVTFTVPFILSDLKLTSRPVAYVTVKATSADGKKHMVDVLFAFSEKIVYRGMKKAVDYGVEQLAGGNLGYLGRKKQEPLYDSGDILDVDWGYIYAAGQVKIVHCSPAALKKYLGGSPALAGKGFRKYLVAEKSAVVNKDSTLNYFFTFAWDDAESIVYFGERKQGYWKKFYPDVRSAIRDAVLTYNEVTARCAEEDKRMENAVIPEYGLSYYTLLLASFRQVVAAHKLIESDGRPVLISKENSSNGCAATVDVTYPSVPLFLTDNPVLVRAMLEPVFKFARMPVWKYDFAPHDAGVYPYVMGQVYGAHGKYVRRNNKDKKTKPIFAYTNEEVYYYKGQMPVEESANMLLLVAAYYNETGDNDFVTDQADLLIKWADYLVSQGIDLENQLSTDDFSGRLPKNVNLAIKSILALGVWAKLSEKTGVCDGKPYRRKAEELATELKIKADRGDRYAIILDKKEGWSTKYNLVWDKIFGLDLFGEDIYKKELAYYDTKMNKYGLPLDYRNTYCKSDWMIWAATLGGKETVRAYSDVLALMLSESETRLPYPDLFETVAPRFDPKTGKKPMYARTVQGGMWLPLYENKVTQTDKKNYLL